ncbi:MAG TPA: hypothetical protein DEA97_00020 [Bacteroidales bacterium]|nr:MAG: hypothetical protein UR43_C0031G0002 [candidate division TM6 bacterium GW2011_GWF2_33_332]HBS84904.1 hypothetical protein [Bacteroidales bacterium]
MTNESNNNVLDETVKCKNSFKCIKCNNSEHFQVILSNQNKVLFVNCKENFSCEFKNYFGNSCFCICPIRIELFSQIDIEKNVIDL